MTLVRARPPGARMAGTILRAAVGLGLHDATDPPSGAIVTHDERPSRARATSSAAPARVRLSTGSNGVTTVGRYLVGESPAGRAVRVKP